MPTIEIKEVNLYNEWTWNIHNTECPICRNNIDEPAIGSNTINICVGKCNHAYHSECISMWIKRKRTCPLCNCKWIEKKLN